MTKRYLLIQGCAYGLVMLMNHTVCGQQFQVDGILKNYNKSIVYLYGFDQIAWERLDSATVTKGHFKLKSSIEHRGWYRIGSSLEYAFEIILGEKKVKLQADFSQFPIKVSYEDSPENQGLIEYQKFLGTARERLSEIDSVSKSTESLKGQELTEARNYLRNHIQQLEEFKNQFYLDFSRNNPTLFVGKLANFYAVHPGISIEDYFTSADFKDPELASPLYFQGKLITCLRQHQVRTTSSLEQLVDHLISVTQQHSEGRQAFYITAIDLLKHTAPDYASSLARRYQMEYSDSETAVKLVASLPKPGPEVGEEAPEITVQDTQGNPLRLSSLRGNYVLLDFWASWCGPCRKEAPSVVAAYNQFKHLGFTIYSVSLDSNRDQWLKAIEKDGLDWYHVSDLTGWKSQAAATYRVRGIPSTYLINPDGKIVAKDLRGTVLTKVLKETLLKPIEDKN